MPQFRRRARTALFPAALLALALAACPSPAPPPDPNALAVATSTDFADQVQAALAAWRHDHPQVKLELAVLPSSDLAMAMAPRLASGAGVPDVLIVDGFFLGRFGPSGALEDLSRPPHDAGPLAQRMPPSLVAQGRAGEAQVGIPMDSAPAALFYRKDLLDRAGVTEADLTGSWEGFVAACGKVKAATGGYCLARIMDLADAVLRSGLQDRQSPYFAANGDALPDQARVARALQLAAAAHLAGIEANAPLETPAWIDLVKSGRMAVQLGGPTMLHRLARAHPASSGRWRAAPLPGGAIVPTPSAFCTLPSHAGHKDLAWDLLRRACLAPAPQVAAYRATGAVPALLEAARDPALDEPVPFLGGEVVGPAFRAAAGRLPMVPVHRLDILAMDALNLEVDRVLEEGKSVEAAVADARAEIETRAKRQR